MSLRDWIERPQSRPLRRLLLKVHLWVALTVGVYIVVISLSGSAVVFRRELTRWLVPRTVETAIGTRLSAEALDAALQEAYPRYNIVEVREPSRPDRPIWVALDRGGRASERLFDPYAARDLGLAFPRSLRVLEWLVDLHDNLLGGTTGRRINALGGAALLLLTVTGAALWWPGRGRWVRSLGVPRPSRTRRFAWHLHSALGFWCSGLLLIWALTGLYFGFPDPIEATIDRLDPDPDDFERPGEPLLLWMVQMHFGRFGGLGVRTLWTLLGLVPAALFVTGFWLWWKRTRRRAAAGTRAEVPGDNADQSA